MTSKQKKEFDLNKIKGIAIEAPSGMSLQKRMAEISESIEILNLELDANIIDGTKAEEYYRLGYELYRLKEEIAKQLSE